MSIVEVPRRVLGKIKKPAISVNGKKQKKICVIRQETTVSAVPTASIKQHPLAEVFGYLNGETWQEIRQERERNVKRQIHWLRWNRYGVKNVYLFDTDTLSNLIEAGRNYPQLQRRVLETDASLIYISIVTIEENLPRLLNRIHNDKNTPRVVERYQALQDYLYVLSKFQILPFDETALAKFDKIPSKVRLHHSNDCRIAAIAISRGFIVVTGNTSDFSKIPHVITEDWMREKPALNPPS